MRKRPENLTITARSPAFDLLPMMRAKRYWLGGDPVRTHFTNAIQAVFPEGERFFIESAKDVSSALSDDDMPADLKADLRAFIQQEARHGNAHTHWTDALVEIGYERMPEYDARLQEMREWSRENISSMRRLALTAALEHMTASLASLLLYKRPELLEDAARPARDVLAWHALEECEHKAVCFDLYQQAGGGYFMRCRALVLAITDLFLNVHARHRYLLEADGLWNWQTRLRVYKDVWGPTGIMGGMYGTLLRYLKPGFHPWDTDERADFRAHYGDLINESL